MSFFKRSILTYVIIFIFCLLLFPVPNASAQTDTVRTIMLNPVFVTETKPTFNTTSRQVVAITNTEMRESGARTLSEALSEVPGVSQLTTGPISKPVIRGLYGDRILIHTAGLRLEDQQWEDEYGLGLSDEGVSRVELIKGPASLLYGAGALGGVVNIVEEDGGEPGLKNHNLNARLFSNSYGAGLDYGFRQQGKNTFLLRAGLESHADYSDGHGNRVPNTRFALYNLKLGYIINREHFRSENRLLTSYNLFGFVADTADLNEDEEESRFSREFEEDHQKVFTALLSSVNTFTPDESTEWRLVAGFQNNLRKEQERAEEDNLQLSLTTFSLNGSLKKILGRNLSLTNGISGMIQSNINYGTRLIVPDATIGEGSVYSYLKYRHGTGDLTGNFEAGARFDHRVIKTRETGDLNPVTGAVPPFTRTYDDFTGSIGESIIFRELVVKTDLSSGFRSGNLAELSANGLHEGTTMWYAGNPGMKPERCLSADVSATWQHNRFMLRGSVFNNWFNDFIYLQPTNETIEGYSLFRYRQTDAILKGFETGFSFTEQGVWRFSADYSFLSAKRTDGSWLPMIPANRLLIDGRYILGRLPGFWKTTYISAGLNYTDTQDRVDKNELPTPSYWLLNAGAGVTIRNIRIMITGRNLNGQLYHDHLSRLKYYGLSDMGRNIIINLGWQF